MDGRKLDQRVLLLYHIRLAGVRTPAVDARPRRFSVKGPTHPVEHNAGHVQSGRFHQDGARTFSGAQQIRIAPLGVRHQVNHRSHDPMYLVIPGGWSMAKGQCLPESPTRRVLDRLVHQGHIFAHSLITRRLFLANLSSCL